MKNISKFCLSIAVALLFHYSVYAQNSQAISIGKCSDLLHQLKNQTAIAKQKNTFIDLQISSTSNLKGKVNFEKSEDENSQFIAGEIENIPASNFHLYIGATSLEGVIILKNEKRAYKYYHDNNGNAFVKEVNINEVICIDYYNNVTSAQKVESTEEVRYLYNLESLPGANGCVLLDFDGQYVSGTPWNGGSPINASPSGMTDAQIRETWELVSEDFRPFSVNITTNQTVFNSYPQNRRMRVVITPTDIAAPGAGGVAYIGSFSWANDTPCWVFVLSGGKNCGEAASHEIGHTFSLGHDGRTTPAEGYFAGHGDWAPIMGVGYYRSISQWSRGEYTAANNTEDDLAKIAAPVHGCGYRADDHGNTTASATNLAVSAAGNLLLSASNTGFIGGTTDIDMFTFNTGGGAVALKFNPAARHADLDILVRLYNSTGVLIGIYNPAGLPAEVNVTLASGRYYVSVDGTGAGLPATTGYSEYASLGIYTITGFIPPYCTAKGGTSLEHIANVTLGSINNTTGSNGGYADFTGLSTSLIRGGSRTISLRAGFSSVAYPEKWAVWIDYNRDGDFSDVGEQVVTTTSTGAAAISATFTVPSTALLGKTRMRVAMRYDASPLPCGTYSYGEVEDYSVTILVLIPVKPEAQTPETQAIQEVDNKELTIYPNPVQDILTIDHINLAKNVTSTIYDISGKEVRTFPVTKSSIQVDVSDLPAGIYFINIRSENENINKRIIKN